jgi:hypothetical protein
MARLAYLMVFQMYQSSKCCTYCPSITTQSSAQCLIDCCTCSKIPASPLIVHKHYPHAGATLLHHRLKWNKLNISNAPQRKFIRLRSGECEGHGQAHINLSTVYQRLNLDVHCEWETEVEPYCSSTTYEFIFIEVHLPWALVQHLKKIMVCHSCESTLQNIGAVSQCPMIPAHTLIENHCWCLDCRIAWGF